MLQSLCFMNFNFLLIYILFKNFSEEKIHKIFMQLKVHVGLGLGLRGQRTGVGSAEKVQMWD